MSNNNIANDNHNDNNCIFVIKDINKECSMKTYYFLLIFLSIIEIIIELLILNNIIFKKVYFKIAIIFLFILSIIYFIFSIYFIIIFKICSKKQRDIVSKMNIKQMNSYKKITKFLMIFGFYITLFYFIFIFIIICFNEQIFPNCDQLDNKNNFNNILNLKSCQYNKCYNITEYYKNKKKEDYNYNYLCNFKLNDYLFDNINKIECINLVKEKININSISSKSFNAFYNEKNNNISKIIYYFLISCDYDYNKYSYICNSKNEINQDYSISDFSIIYNINEYDNEVNNIEETQNEINYKNGECVSIFSFLFFIFFHLVIFFTLPIKVDIWFNENKRFEIIKKRIHPNRLRVNATGEDINYEIISNSNSTDNSSENSSESNISENSQDINSSEVAIQN